MTFSYPDSDRVALRDIDLEIRPGEVAALVGQNGSGKTTLVKLLCRLYDPQSGSVTLDGVDLREMGVTELRQAMSVVFQDYSQYYLTARENIWVGDATLDLQDEAIVEAARLAGADEVISSLGHGYDTMLGKLFDEGEELSVGEWQKVAVARSFVRDADIMVFDEPTSALDPLSEWNVFERIRERAKGRSVVLISHRFSTVRNADRIHILEHGHIVESGSHEELMRARRQVRAHVRSAGARLRQRLSQRRIGSVTGAQKVARRRALAAIESALRYRRRQALEVCRSSRPA